MTPITQRGRRLCSQRLWDGELLLLHMFLMLLSMLSWWRIRNDLMTLSLRLLVKIIQIIIIRIIFLLIFWFCCWFWSLSDSKNMFFVFLSCLSWKSFCSFSRKGLNIYIYIIFSVITRVIISCLSSGGRADGGPAASCHQINIDVGLRHNIVLVFFSVWAESRHTRASPAETSVTVWTVCPLCSCCLIITADETQTW